MSFPNTAPPWAASEEAFVDHLALIVAVGCLLIVAGYCAVQGWMTRGKRCACPPEPCVPNCPCWCHRV